MISLIPRKISIVKKRLSGFDFISVKSGQGLDVLHDRMCELLDHKLEELELHLPFDRFDIMAKIHRLCHIHAEKYEDNYIYVSCAAPQDFVEK